MIPFLYRWLRNVPSPSRLSTVHIPRAPVGYRRKPEAYHLDRDSEVRCAKLVIVFPYPTNTRRNNFIKNRIKNNQEILSHLDGLKASL